MNNPESTFCFVQLYHISERGGGAEVQAGYLSSELASRGFNVHYICQTTQNEKVLTTSKNDGVTMHWLPLMPSLASANLKRIKDILLEVNPTFIIERMTSSYGWPIVKVKRKINAKYVWICTDNKSPELFSKVTEFYKKLSFIKFILTLPKSLSSDAIRWIANRKADVVFSQNETQRQLIKKNFNRDSSKMISGHPLPSLVYTSKEHFSFKTVLWCANFGAHKRPELFIELARAMEYDTSIKFVMVGGHSNKAYLNDLLKHKPGNLEVTGQLAFDEALHYFNKASVFVNSSVSEGFSNTYIQAWLRRVPVIVFGADSDKIIEKNQLGFDVTSIEEAKEHISSMMSDYNIYETLSENAYNYGLKNHSIKVMTDNFLKVLTNSI